MYYTVGYTCIAALTPKIYFKRYDILTGVEFENDCKNCNFGVKTEFP